MLATHKLPFGQKWQAKSDEDRCIANKMAIQMMATARGFFLNSKQSREITEFGVELISKISVLLRSLPSRNEIGFVKFKNFVLKLERCI